MARSCWEMTVYSVQYVVVEDENEKCNAIVYDATSTYRYCTVTWYVPYDRPGTEPGTWHRYSTIAPEWSTWF